MVVKEVESHFEDALSTSYMKSNSNLKAATINIAEQVLNKVFQSASACTAVPAEARNLGQIQRLIYTIVQPLLSNAEFTFLIIGRMCKPVNRAIEE